MAIFEVVAEHGDFPQEAVTEVPSRLLEAEIPTRSASGHDMGKEADCR